MTYSASNIRVFLELPEIAPRCGNSAVFKLAKDITKNALRAFDITYQLNGSDSSNSNFSILVDGNVVYEIEGSVGVVPPVEVSSSVLLQQIASAASSGSMVLRLPESIQTSPVGIYLVAFAIVAKIINPGCAGSVTELMKLNASLVTQYFEYKSSVDVNYAVLKFWNIFENVIYASRGSYILPSQLVLALDEFTILKGELKSLVNPKTFWFNNKIIYDAYAPGPCKVPAGLYCNSSCDFAITTNGCEPSLMKAINMKK